MVNGQIKKSKGHGTLHPYACRRFGFGNRYTIAVDSWTDAGALIIVYHLWRWMIDRYCNVTAILPVKRPSKLSSDGRTIFFGWSLDLTKSRITVWLNGWSQSSDMHFIQNHKTLSLTHCSLQSFGVVVTVVLLQSWYTFLSYTKLGKWD